MATQLSVIRGDYFGTQTVNLSSSSDDYTGLSCTGHIRTHPDGSLLHQFVPTVVSGVSGAATVTFSLAPSVTKTFPPINLYGDIEFYASGINSSTLYEFRLNVLPDTTHL